jgi:type IV secretory pathway VirB3-like protein
MDAEKDNYASYNVLNRKALIFGIPIITLVILLCVALAFAAIGMKMFGIVGLMPSMIVLFVLFIIRVLCQDDSRALDRICWNIKSAWYRFRCRSTITSFTSVCSSTTKRKQNAREFFKNNLNE